MFKVGLFIESSRASGRALLEGVARYGHNRTDWSFYWEPGGLDRAWPKLRSLQLNGILLRDVVNLDEVLSLGIPAVVVGHSRSEVPSLINVVTDSKQVAWLAAEHLMGCGFRNFAFCGYGHTLQEKTSWSVERRQHFADHIARAGFQRPRAHSVSMHSTALVSRDWPSQLKALVKWLTSLPKPVGLMACNDDCGRLVMDACHQAGLTMPDIVGIIGADNDEVVCGLTDPPLSSVAINFAQAGYEAAGALDGLMEGRRSVLRRIEVTASHVVARRSTDFVAAGDVGVAKALRFIRDHARQPLRVSDVAVAAGLSRRALEKHFREELGRSVMEEIRRVRTDRIAQMLVETDLPVGRIAEMLGFEDMQHVARYFRAAKKMSPRTYRKTHSRT